MSCVDRTGWDDGGTSGGHWRQSSRSAWPSGGTAWASRCPVPRCCASGTAPGRGRSAPPHGTEPESPIAFLCDNEAAQVVGVVGPVRQQWLGLGRVAGRGRGQAHAQPAFNANRQPGCRCRRGLVAVGNEGLQGNEEHHQVRGDAHRHHVCDAGIRPSANDTSSTDSLTIE